jgi:hypothetical protein
MVKNGVIGNIETDENGKQGDGDQIQSINSAD